MSFIDYETNKTISTNIVMGLADNEENNRVYKEIHDYMVENRYTYCVYFSIIEYFFKHKTYVMIAEKYNVNTITVQRGVKRGLKQLHYYVLIALQFHILMKRLFFLYMRRKKSAR